MIAQIKGKLVEKHPTHVICKRSPIFPNKLKLMR